MSTDLAIQTGRGWAYSVPPPSSFDYRAQARYQAKIDAIAGTRDSRPLIKLAWAPDELRWMPHRLGEEPQGYTYPIFCTGRDEFGRFIAPERWVLLERVEPEQFAHGWEGKRYVNQRGTIWDVKGPCPTEKYVELRCHAYHDTKCCPCTGDECYCGDGLTHCWGKYAQPDEHLLNWIRKAVWEARQDADVDPLNPNPESPNAQRELVSQFHRTEERKVEISNEAWRHIADTFERQPHSVTRRNDSRIITLN